MIAIGLFTVFASVNTFEVIAQKDVSLSSVIKETTLTRDPNYNQFLKDSNNKTFQEGSFGIPSKIKFPESRQHIKIQKSNPRIDTWQTSRGLANVFISDNSKKKVFGEAVIYMRYNTPTTKHLGDVLNGDIVNVITSEGWQLGYQVQQTTTDPVYIDRAVRQTDSRIIVIMVNDKNKIINSFQASLVKVGDRI